MHATAIALSLESRENIVGAVNEAIILTTLTIFPTCVFAVADKPWAPFSRIIRKPSFPTHAYLFLTGLPFSPCAYLLGQFNQLPDNYRD